jgi:hypothetical protein
MTLSCTGTRPFRTATMIRAAVVAILAVLPMLAAHPAAAQQPLPIRELAYSAKFLCGSGSVGGDESLPPDALEFTVVEIHNPHSIPVTITIKWVQDYPSYLLAIPPYQVTLASNEALNLDCSDFYFPGCPPICGTSFRGFVEIRSPQQLKVVALYKEIMDSEGVTISASVAKQNSIPYLFAGLYRHSAAFLSGDQTTAKGDVIRHETTFTMTNMSNNPVNANVHILSNAGPVVSFPRNIPPNSVSSVTDADLPAFVPRPFAGSVMVNYGDIGLGALLACEEILQKHVLAGPRNTHIAMSVVEVQPIPLR